MTKDMRVYQIGLCPVYQYFKDINNEKVLSITREESEGGGCTMIYRDWEEGFLFRFKALVQEGLDVSGCEVQAGTRNALKELLRDFQASALYRYNVLRLGRRNCFQFYLLGLPSILDIPCEYTEVYHLLQEWTGVDLYEVRRRNGERHFSEDEVTDFFYWHVEKAVNSLLRENSLPKLDNLKILG